jgi:hypothetical protein
MTPHHAHSHYPAQTTEKYSIIWYVILLAAVVFVFCINHFSMDGVNVQWTTFRRNSNELEERRIALKNSIHSLKKVNDAIAIGWEPQGKDFETSIELLRLIKEIEQHLFLQSGSKMTATASSVIRPPTLNHLLRNQNIKVESKSANGGDKIVQLMNSAIHSSVPRLMQLKVDLLALPSREILRHPKSSEMASSLVQVDLSVLDVTRIIEEAATLFTTEQMSTNALPRSKNQSKYKVQIGAAGDSSLLDNWINIDVLGGRAIRTKDDEKPIEIAMNVASTPLPFDENSCETFYLAHVLEHLEFPDQTFYLLSEIFRTLDVGGVVRIIVPDADKWMHEYLKDKTGKQTSFWQTARNVWTDWNWDDEPILPLVLAYLGALDNNMETPNPHRAGYDVTLLTKVLQNAGFQKVNVSTYKKIDDISEAASAYWIDEKGEKKYYSLFIEATK